MRDEHNDRTVIERADPLVGSVLDRRYRIDFRIAAGGFGAIYRATHVKSGHQVALKVLHTELATSDARVIARFRREGSLLSQLRDPHTVTAYELGESDDGPLYIVMELLHGESLYEQYRSRGPLPWQRMVGIALQVCSSLAEAHSLGIVHRDLKPANINLETRDGTADFVKVLDFGIAKIVRESAMDNSELTQAGQMIGTFDYMAPEQMVGGQCTACTDIYTLGVVMYEMITGRRPFADAATPTALLASLLTLTPTPLSAHVRVPAELDRIVLKCLEREPQSRYAGVVELVHDLEGLFGVDEGVTRRMSVTPPPVLQDEVTVIASPRAERPKRDSAQPHPNVIRREPTPVPADMRPRRDSSPPPPPQEWRAPSPPIPGVHDAQTVAVAPAYATPVPSMMPPPAAPAPAAPPAPVAYEACTRPATPPPPPVYPYPHAPHDPRGVPPVVAAPVSLPMVPPAARGSSYDMSGVHNRDVLVRRIVWSVAFVLGIILAIVVATRI